METRLPHQGDGVDPLHIRSVDTLYFHADDMGATPNITTRLLDSWETGLIDGFSILGGSDHSELIASRLQALPDRPARIAVHLNLAEGRPLSPSTRSTRLVDGNGHFNIEFFGFLNRYYLPTNQRERNTLVSEVEREWRAQIEDVIKIVEPRPVAALDGHIHMHMMPFLFPLAVKLAGEYDIPEIRNVRESFYLSQNIKECLSKRFLVNCVKRAVLSRFSDKNAICAEAAGLKSPDRMLGVLYSGRMSRANILTGIAAARRQGAERIEVFMHIGRATNSELGRWNGNRSKASFAMSPWRDTEYEELTKIRGQEPPEWRERRAS